MEIIAVVLSVIAFLALVRIESHTAKARKHLERIEALTDLHVKESAAARPRPGASP